jgi:DNA primase
MYLKSRGVSSKQVREYRLGLTPTKVNIEGHEGVYLVGNRIVIPMIDEYHRVRGFCLRSISTPGSKNSHHKIYTGDSKGYLYGIHNAVEHMYRTGSVLVVEGPFDLFAVQPYFPACVAMLTSNLSKKQREILKRYVKHIYFVPDNDPTGRDSKEQALKFLSRDFEVSVVDSKWKDLSEWRSKNKEEVEDYFSFLYSIENTCKLKSLR